jgi:hypothetical protein
MEKNMLRKIMIGRRMGRVDTSRSSSMVQSPLLSVNEEDVDFVLLLSTGVGLAVVLMMAFVMCW